MTIIDCESYFFEQQALNQKLMLSPKEINTRIIRELEIHVNEVIKKTDGKIMGFHLQLYTQDKVYPSNDLRFLPNADPLGDAELFYDDDE